MAELLQPGDLGTKTDGSAEPEDKGEDMKKKKDGKEEAATKPLETQDAGEDIRQELAQLREQNAKFAEALAKRDIDAQIKTLVDDRRLTPAQTAGLAEFMAQVPESGVVEFGEGDAKKNKLPASFCMPFWVVCPARLNTPNLPDRRRKKSLLTAQR